MNDNKKNLKKLIAEWDKRLKDSGFVDIEDRKTGLLKKCGGDYLWDAIEISRISDIWDENIKREIKFDGKGYSTFVWKQSQAEYYRIASIMCHDGEFKTEREREIWVFHAEGLSYREISKKINLTPRQVFYTIQTLEKRFGLFKNDS